MALAVFALTWTTLLEYNLPYDDKALYFVFFATITGYNFVKYFGLAKFHHRRLAIWLKTIQIFSALAFVAMCFYFFQLSENVMFLIVVLALVTFLYAIPFIPKHFLFDEQQNLRQIGGAKVYIIALVWSLATVLIPLLNFEYALDASVLTILFQRFCLVIVLMLPFEIRDLQYDNLKLATIPQKIGIKKTKIIGSLLLLVFVMLEFFKDGTDKNSTLATLLMVLIALFLLEYSKQDQSKYYSAFWVEAIPIIWLLLLILFC